MIQHIETNNNSGIQIPPVILDNLLESNHLQMDYDIICNNKYNEVVINQNGKMNWKAIFLPMQRSFVHSYLL